LEVFRDVWGFYGNDDEETGDDGGDEDGGATGDVETLQFTYDNLSQLVGVSLNATPTASYQIDRAGNLLSLTVNGTTTNFAYNSNNQPTTPATSTFDAKGQTVTQGDRSFEWDDQGRVTAIVQGAHRSELGYDGMSHRTTITELDNGTVTSKKLYWWLGGHIVSERDGLQTDFPITKRYFAQGVIQNGTRLYYTKDHLGSIRQSLDTAGEVVADYRYSTYGVRTKVSGTLDCDYGYAGLFHHEPSGLDLATYRLYDPKQQRFDCTRFPVC
jgi:YD repeat-containing protein